MIIKSAYGVAAAFTPRDSRGLWGFNKTHYNQEDIYVRIVLFTGDIPDTDTLYNITTSEELATAYPDTIVSDNTVVSMFMLDYGKNERTIYPKNQDALTSVCNVDGTISWAAFVFPGDRMVFTDAIGTWDDTDNIVLVDDLTVTAGSNTTMKTFKIMLRDTLVEVSNTGA